MAIGYLVPVVELGVNEVWIVEVGEDLGIVVKEGHKGSVLTLDAIVLECLGVVIMSPSAEASEWNAPVYFEV